jgi:hypothetical protein
MTDAGQTAMRTGLLLPFGLSGRPTLVNGSFV